MENIINQRDKYFAHNDKEYLSNSDRLSEDYPISIEDVDNIMSTAWDILNNHKYALDYSKRVPRNDFAVVGMEEVLMAIRREDRRS